MKRWILASAFLAATAFGAAAQAPVTFTILHTNDVHSRHQPINRFDVTCSDRELAERQCNGGSARLAARVNALRQEIRAGGGNVVVMNAGDYFQGSLLFTHYRGEAEARMMNAIAYDVMALGNHEFDDGPATLARFVRAVRFPVLSANLDVSREPQLQGDIIRPFTILEIGGRRVGVIGVTTEDTPITSSPGPTLTFRRTEDVLPPIIANLRGQGVTTIVLLTHLGLPRDQEVARSVAGISLIVGGHSHTLLANGIQGAEGAYPVYVDGPGGRRVPIVQASWGGRYLGRLNVTIDPAGTVTAATGNVELLGADLAEDDTVRAEVTRLAEPLEAVRRRVIGELAGDVDQTRCREQECQMGNLVTDAMLWRLRPQNVQIVIMNGGGLRSGMAGGPATLGGVLTVLPFQNTVATMRLSGANVRAALEVGAAARERGTGRFSQVAGLRYTWDRSLPIGSRIVSVDVRQGNAWVPLDPNAIYVVATNNFMRRGGDGYEMFRDHAIDPYDFGEPLEDAVAAYIQQNSPVRAELDGRITTR